MAKKLRQTAPGSRAIIATVTLNGRANGEFIVDTGATNTMIPDDLARRAGIDTGPLLPRVRVRTAGGDRTLPRSPVESVAIGGLAVNGIEAIVGDLPGMDNRGLLGMDFLGAFVIENDPENGRMVLSRR